MKALIISVTVFALLGSTIFVNFIYLNKTADELKDLTNSLTIEPSGEATLEKLEKKWDKASFFFCLSVNYREINSMDELLLSLRAAYDAKKEYEFGVYKTLLLDCIDDLRRLERFSAENIF